MVKVVVDGAKCKGHGQCAMIAPDVFFINDAGFAEVCTDVVVTSELRERLEDASLMCPESAIEIEEASNGRGFRDSGNVGAT